MSRSYALYARVSYHGDVVEERSVRSGRAMQIGGTPTFAVPLPEGLQYLARAMWTTPSTVAVRDGSGALHTVTPGNDVVIEVGPLELRLTLVEQFALRRTERWSARGSIAWLAIVVMSSVVTYQVVWVESHRCELAFSFFEGLPDVGLPLALVFAPLVGGMLALFALLTAENPRRAWPALGLPLAALLVPLVYHFGGFTYQTGDVFLVREFSECMGDPSQGGGLAGGAFSAEYLARLLRDDLDGADRGVVETEIDRPESERKLREHEVYMPAGANGPITRMGGAERVAPSPVRSLDLDEQIAVPARSDRSHPLEADEGVQIDAPNPSKDDQDGTADGLDVPSKSDEGRDAPAEEHEGWGLPAWYDEQDAAMDQIEIEVMLRAAKDRLRIDPDDAAALSILSYYQYLAQDYDAAKRTYDRFIELYPDDAAGYNNKALVYKRLGEYQKEESLYRVALSLAPNDVTAMNNLGVNLAHQRRFDEALSVMRELELLDPHDPYADLHRAKIHAEMGEDEEALRYLERALEGMEHLDTLHHIEFRQDIRLDPSLEKLRGTFRFQAILNKYYGKDSPLQE